VNVHTNAEEKEDEEEEQGFLAVAEAEGLQG